MAKVRFFNKRVGVITEYDKIRTMKYYTKGVKFITTDNETFFIEYKDIDEMTLELNEQ